MGIQRVLGALLTLPVLVGGLLLMTAGPAAACSCMAQTEAEYAARADAIFVGRKVDLPRPAGVGRQAEAGAVVIEFRVTQVYKGTVTDPQEIVTLPSGGTCGLELAGEGPFLVFAHKPTDNELVDADPSQYISYLCDGSRALADGGEPKLGPFGTARPPAPGEQTPLVAWLALGAGLLAMTTAGVVAVVRSRGDAGASAGAV